MDEFALSNLQDRIWKGGGAGEEDMMRWYDQGFVFGDSPNFGLRQTCGGGPCGVLAAVTCEMVKVLLYSKNGHMNQNGGDIMQPPPTVHESLPTFTQDEVYDAFSIACVAILFRASTGGSITLVDCPDPRTYPDLALYSPSNDLIVHTFAQTNQAISFIRQRVGQDQLFGSRCGCILFVMSLLLTRGLPGVINDMDVESNTMIGPFGHCNQVTSPLHHTTYYIPINPYKYPTISSTPSSGTDESIVNRSSYEQHHGWICHHGPWSHCQRNLWSI